MINGLFFKREITKIQSELKTFMQEKDLSSYRIIIDLCQAIQLIQNASLKIKLRSLNSIIGLSKNKDDSSGFSAVSVDLIDFSIQVNGYADSLSSAVNKILHASTNIKKIDRRIQLISKSSEGNKFVKRLEEDRKNWLELCRVTYKDIKNQIQKAIKICKLGNVVVIFSKIEAAYMGSESKSYSKLSEDVNEAIDSILDSFERIKINIGNNQ